MASLSSNNDYISVTCESKTYVIPFTNIQLFSVDHNSIKDAASKSTDKTNICRSNGPGPRSSESNEDIGIGLLCSDLSSQGNLLAFCTFSKLLCIANLSSTEVSVKNVYCLTRGASKVKFTPSGKSVVVADKSGDVYLFNLQKENDLGQLILGHLSMLLDVLVTPDEQFIITCDRDEKIRVSCFPNGYNIVAYCLGHCEFVSSILLFPSDNRYLVSASGDGTIRFWDYKIGKESAVCNTISFFNDETEVQTKLDIDKMAITDAGAMAIDSSTSIVCVTLECINICLIIKCSCEGGNFKFFLNQKMSLDESSPWKLSLSGDILWMVLNAKDKVNIKAMKLIQTPHHTFVDDLPESVTKTVNILNLQLMDTEFKNIVSLLYKRKFDNIQEYLNKKESRKVLLEPCNKKVKN